MIRVLIVDDELLLRSCMQQILESDPDITVPSTCDGAQAVRAVAQHRPESAGCTTRTGVRSASSAGRWRTCR